MFWKTKSISEPWKDWREMIDTTRGALNSFKKVNNSFISTKLFQRRLRQRAMDILLLFGLINHKISLVVALLRGLHAEPMDGPLPWDTIGVPCICFGNSSRGMQKIPSAGVITVSLTLYVISQPLLKLRGVWPWAENMLYPSYLTNPSWLQSHEDALSFSSQSVLTLSLFFF